MNEAEMGILHTYNLVKRSKLTELCDLIGRVIAGEPVSLLEKILDFDALAGSYGPIEVVTVRRGLIRRRDERWLDPDPQQLIQAYFEQRDPSDERRCCVEKLFSRWERWGLRDKGASNVSRFRKELWGTATGPIPTAFIDEGLGVIDDAAIPSMIATARQLIDINRDSDDGYIQDCLEDFASLLEAKQADDVVVVGYG